MLYDRVTWTWNPQVRKRLSYTRSMGENFTLWFAWHIQLEFQNQWFLVHDARLFSPLFLCSRKEKIIGYIPIPSHLCMIILLKQDWVKEHYIIFFLLRAKKWTIRVQQNTHKGRNNPFSLYRLFNTSYLLFITEFTTEWHTGDKSRTYMILLIPPDQSVCAQQ